MPPFSVDELVLSTTMLECILSSRTVDDTAAVSAAQATAFIAGISEQNKQDVLSSTLLAQLAANAKYDRFENPEKWYEQYIYVLENVGWVVGNFKFDAHSLSKTDVSVDTVVLSFMKTCLNPSQVAVMRRCINAMGNPKQPAVKTFNESVVLN
ncbi:hypothetical protein BDZ97DRAFT_2080309 [Flammula alnicola]|nr:hypothetical protein BDZ97DRAFT_2080309 [Flammula alnicola]